MMNPYAIPPLIASLLAFLLGLFVLLKTRKSKSNILFSLESISISLWLYFDYMMYSSPLLETKLFWAKVAYIPVIFIPLFFLHFALSFSKSDKFRKTLISGYVSSFIFVLILFLTNYVISGVERRFWGFYPKVGFLHSVLLVYFGILITMTFWVFYSRSKDKTRPPQERNMFKLVSVAFIIAYLGCLDFLPKYGFDFYPFGFIFISVWFIVVAFAIIKHRLFDIHLVISRSTAYALTFLLGILPMAIILYFLQKVFPLTVPVTLVIALAVVLSFAFHKIYPYSERFVQTTLFKKRLDYYHILRKFSSDMVTALDLQNLLQRFDQTLHEALQVSSVAFYLTGPVNGKYPLIHASRKRDFVIGRLQESRAEQPEVSSEQKNIECTAAHMSGLIPQWKSGDALVSMAYQTKDVLVLGEMEMMAKENKNETLDQSIAQMREAKAEVCMPLKRDDTMIGIALLGPREKDQYYAPGDLELLHIMGQNACVAIQNALLVEDMIRSYQLLHRTQRFAAVGELVAGLSHEIRNPLMPIIRLMELAADSPVDGERLKSQSETVRKALRRITGVLNEIEELAAPYKPEFKPAEIGQLLDSAITALEPQIKPRKQEIIQEYADLPELMVDADRLGQVFLDVLLNAVEANPDGGRVWVRTREIVLHGDLMGIQVEIEDHGCGITLENMERVFDPFFTTKYKSVVRKGTGLGLSIAQRIVEDHHGTIELISTVGTGTRAFINLPTRERKN